MPIIPQPFNIGTSSLVCFPALINPRLILYFIIIHCYHCCHLIIDNTVIPCFSHHWLKSWKKKTNWAHCRITNKEVNHLFFFNVHLELSLLFRYICGGHIATVACAVSSFNMKCNLLPTFVTILFFFPCPFLKNVPCPCPSCFCFFCFPFLLFFPLLLKNPLFSLE